MKKNIFYSLFFILYSFSFSFAQDAEGYYKKGEHKFQMGMYDEAIEEFTKALELDSNHFNALSRRGFCYSFNGNYDGAIEDFDKVIKQKPDYAQAYLSRGSAKNKLKKYSEAIVDFNKVISLDAQNTEALNNRGWAKKGLGDFKGACDDWKKSKKSGNNEAKIILQNNQCK